MTEAACMAHVRRKFFDIHAETKSPQSHEVLQRIAALYAIEAMIRGEPADVRLRIRTERSAPLFAQFRTWLDATLSRVSGKSEMAKAIRYALARWDALTLVLRDGRVCIDNNAAERSMRPMTIEGSFCPYQQGCDGPLPLACVPWSQCPAALRRAAVRERGRDRRGRTRRRDRPRRLDARSGNMRNDVAWPPDGRHRHPGRPRSAAEGLRTPASMLR